MRAPADLRPSSLRAGCPPVGANGVPAKPAEQEMQRATAAGARVVFRLSCHPLRAHRDDRGLEAGPNPARPPSLTASRRSAEGRL